MSLYAVTKLIHIASLIFWIGPALGSWLVLKHGERNALDTKTMSFIYRVFFWTLAIEHLAFIVLLITGAILAFGFSIYPSAWIQQKLLLILLVLLPLEVADIWLGHCRLQKAFIARKSVGDLQRAEPKLLNFYHGIFTRIAVLVMPPTVLAVMWLAVAKVPIVTL